MTDPRPDLDAAYGLETPEDNRRLYAAWAGTYDSGFASDMAYVLPLRVAEAFADAGGRGHVLDLGAGTGLCGEALVRLGAGPVDATDLSPDMLRVAEAKGIYQRLFEGDLLRRLDVAYGHYAGAVSSGTFTHGHVGPEAMDEVVRILAPGGLAALSINAGHYDSAGFAAKFDALSVQAITDLRLKDVAIYGAGAEGDHAQDRALIALFRRA
ncbi:class I SAM-dependent methyltransferase [Aestuariicoccus sp. MJ-SS9]|uniref:class I SAM-dependent DNA methyltransferase n=1 Tax=Aestuariicoccus sp. MJ-SS9 TaxID=3079855 RepID=UPI002907B227|nr:class I SAM-dependent methyltransferase [Aestuariicoccus sp. MJ-SS9]MDU8911688.1 class I SAM-dependent methyltransferase [Aestuariicoccus sp. MJ-SS9]